MEQKGQKVVRGFPVRFLAIRLLDRRDSTTTQLFVSSTFNTYSDQPLKVARKIPHFFVKSKALKIDLGQSVVILEVTIPDSY